MTEIPPLFEWTRIADFDNNEMMQYNPSCRSTERRRLAMEAGKEDAKLEGKLEVIRNLLGQAMFSLNQIAEIVALPVSVVEEMKALTLSA